MMEGSIHQDLETLMCIHQGILNTRKAKTDKTEGEADKPTLSSPNLCWNDQAEN